jgi:hypothetical protein
MSKPIGYLRYFVTSDEAEKGPAYEGVINGTYYQFRPSTNTLVAFDEDRTEVKKQYQTQREDRSSFTVRKPAKDAMSLLYYRRRGDDGDNFAVHAGIQPRFNRPSVQV